MPNPIDLFLVAIPLISKKRRERSRKWNAEIRRRDHEDELIKRLIQAQESARRARVNGM